MDDHPSRKVRAILDCYVEHVYRKAGEEFTYSGSPSANVLQESPDDVVPRERSEMEKSSQPGLQAAHAPGIAADEIRVPPPSASPLD